MHSAALLQRPLSCAWAGDNTLKILMITDVHFPRINGALLPGFSRSGLTISAALLGGLKRRWAAEYSFFLAIPTIFAATTVQGIEVARNGGLGELDYGVMVTAFVVAAAVGTLALRMVLYFLYRARMKVFSFYLWALAAAVLLGVISLG